jgi:hypothetical protein
MWGPVLGWCALELLAESIDRENPERVALDLFDRLRLREPFAQAFVALGFEGEDAWRVAARVKVGLLIWAGVGKPEEAIAATEPESGTGERVAFSPELWLDLWSDPDVRWLCGVHEAEGRDYLVRERYEELLWWLLMPSLLRLAGETAPSQVTANRATILTMSRTIEEALAAAEAAGYRMDLLRQRPSSDEAIVNKEPEPAAPETEPKAGSAADPG